MALPASGLISLSAINVELGKAANAPISLNDADVRGLLAKPSGSLSLNDAHGKTKIAPGVSFITGLFYETNGGTPVYGWNLLNIWGLLPTGSATPSPIPMSPYAGTLYGVVLLYGDSYEAYAINIFQDFYMTLNGNKILFTYGGVQDGYSYFYGSIFNNVFSTPGQSNTLSFG